MKANLKVGEVAKAVKLCVNAIEPKDPIQSNICFEAEEGVLRLKASNNQYSIEISCPCDVQEEGIATVDGKMAYNVISKASGECVLTSDDKSMTIKSRGRTKLPNIEHELKMVSGVSGKQIVFNAVEFRNAINKVSYAISEDQSRMVLTGAHIVTNGTNATITSLDGFRLAQTVIPCEGEEIDIIVPSKILTAICDAVTDGELSLVSNGIKISVSGDNFTINAVTLSGSYIDTARIIPTSFSTNALIKTADIKDCADSATVASGSTNLVKLNISNESILIVSNSGNADFQGDVNTMVDGNDLTIAFNLKYLIQAFSHIDTEECEMHFSTANAPAIIKPRSDGNNDLHLILPVRIFS